MGIKIAHVIYTNTYVINHPYSYNDQHSDRNADLVDITSHQNADAHR